MIPTTRIPTHPGEILVEEFLGPLEISQARLAAQLGVPARSINELIKGKRRITPATAWLLSNALGTTPGFWMTLQVARDLARARRERHIKRLVR